MSESVTDTRRKASLKLEGNLTIYEAGLLKERLLMSLEEGDLLLINMAEVRECDTSGLQVFCSAKKTADRKGKQIVIAGISKAVEDAMIKTGINREMIAQDGGAGCQR